MAASSFFFLLGLGIVLVPASVVGDAGLLGDLKAEYRLLETQRDSLEVQRLLVAAEAEALSTHVDSLKSNGELFEELQESLRSSLTLVQRMVNIDRRLALVDARQDSLEERLRLGYDWEIGVLIQRLSNQPDEGLLTQLMVYQEARERLGSKVFGASLRYGEQMRIGIDDGPDEIQQKLELMEDIAYRLKAELHATVESLRQLEEEYRMRTRMRGDSGGMQNFEPPIPQGRVLVRGEQQGGQVRYQIDDDLRAGLGLPSSSTDEVVLEIHKLKARQQEVSQLEAVVKDRAKAFRLYLHSMLEGEE